MTLTDCDFTLITLQTYVIYVTGNRTNTIGSNGSSLTPNISCYSQLYYQNLKDKNCSTDLCILLENNGGVKYRTPDTYRNYTYNETKLLLYDISNITTITYILLQCNGSGDINTTNYNVTVAFNPFISLLPITEKYTNTKDATIIAPVIPCVLIVALMIAGYLYYRARIKTRSDHEYKEPQYTTVD